MTLTEEKIQCRPEEAGYDGERLTVLNRHFQRMIDARELQGATYCISRNGKVIAYGGLGKMSFREDDDRPLLPDSVHHIASITKMFTTVAIFQLAEDGLIRLDNRAGEYLEQMNEPPFSEITLAQLLSHTSGLHPDPGCFPSRYAIVPWDEIAGLDERGDGDRDWIRAALRMGMRRKPGEEWQYCSFGYALLGAVIEKVTGIFAEEFIVDRIVKPLGLEDTGFRENEKILKRHIVRDEKMEKEINDILAGKNPYEGMENSVWRLVPRTGGGMFSTAYDLVRFGNVLCHFGRFDGVRLLGRKAIEKMTAPYLKDMPSWCWGNYVKDRAYGLGPDLRNNVSIMVSDGFFFHEGAGACCLAIDPKERLTAAWMVPYADRTKWFPTSLFNVKNIIWSGLM